MDESNVDTFDDVTEDFSPAEEVDPSTIIVIHPGSRFLRIGLASDPVPKKLLNAIARKRKNNNPAYNREDPFVIPKLKLDDEKRHLLDDGCNKVAQMLMNSLRSDGRKRFSDKRVAGLNAAIKKPDRIPAEEVEDDESLPKQDWLETKSESVVGDDILYLHPTSEYNVHFPVQRGEVNLTPLVGGSQTGVLADLETIWRHAIENLLKIPISDLPKYRAVLIIPALYRRSLIKHYLTILLTNLGFGRAFVLQDHVAATFGAGLGYACVVDMGDQKTSISCVEDGISHPETRIHLDYGGADITQIFHYILRRVGFPYHHCNPVSNRFDAQLLYGLKEDNCHLNIDVCGLAEKAFHVALPGESVIDRYTFFLSDECLIAPNSIFYPDLFELTSSNEKKRTRFHTKNQGDPEDPHDNNYLTETSRKYTKAGETTAGEMMAGDNEPNQNMDDDLDIVNEDTTQGGSTHCGFNSNNSSSPDDGGLLLPLDVAIRKSIEACPTEELKKKMFGCILLVGGGIRFKGVTKYLHQRLSLQIPLMYRTEPLEIILDPKDLSSEMTVWKGAAVLSGLESARELWIKPDEWQKVGQKLLREKAPFPWT